MRVVVLNDQGYINGGAAQVAISSLNGLAEAGLDVTFVSGVGPVDPSLNRNLLRIENFGFYELLGNPSRVQAAVRGIWDSRCASLLRQVLQGFDRKETIIHLHSWVQTLTSSVVDVAISMGFKVVCTLHDYFSVCPNGGLHNFPQGEQCKLRPMSFDCITTNCDSRNYAQKLWRVTRQTVQSRFITGPAGIRNFITVSGYSEAILRPLLPATSRFFRVNNPIDIDKHSPACVRDNNSFTFVGRLTPEKGADVFAAAAQQAGVRAVFVGSGAEKPKIAAIYPSAEFLPWQDRTGVIRVIQASRAIVFPSVLHETQGMVVTEAASLGVPAIVSDRCAARDGIVEGETGILFRTGDMVDLAAKLTLLNDRPGWAKTLGSNAYDRYWNAPSTVATHVKQLIACYQEVLESK